MINKTLNNIFKGDKVVWMVFFFLCIISVIEVYSASSQLTYKAGSYAAPILKHFGLLIVGVIFTVVTVNIPCRYFRILPLPLLVFAFVTLIAVLFLGSSTNGAQRWYSIMGIQFQPSEVAKGALVLSTAQILSTLQTDDGADKDAFKFILWTCAFIIPPIMVENLSTAVLLCFVVLLMMIIGRVPMRQIGKLLGVVMLGLVLIVGAVMALGHDNTQTSQATNMTETKTAPDAKPEEKGGVEKVFHRFDTWKARIDKFLNHKEVAPKDVDLDKDAQVAHANIAIASSNVVGKGPGNSDERDFMSQAFSDFIYAIIIEETGVIGAGGVALLYIILLFRAGRIANHCENNFPALLAMGLALLLVTQAFFNMAVAVGLAPVTGQPLPLISKGGTSSIINCIYIGMILSISRSAKKKGEPEAQPATAATAAEAAPQTA